MSECPVCYAETVSDYQYEEYVLCGIDEKCPHGCYSYDFSYGYHTLTISIRGHAIPFYWTYHDDGKELRCLRERAIEIVAKRARMALIEDLRTPPCIQCGKPAQFCFCSVEHAREGGVPPA